MTYETKTMQKEPKRNPKNPMQKITSTCGMCFQEVQTI